MKSTKRSTKMKITQKQKAFLASIALLTASGGAYAGYQVYKAGTIPPVQLAHMVRVIDGDTFEVENGERVRLGDIDAPELGECGGDMASDELTELLTGKKLLLKKDVEDKDNFGRSVRFVNILNTTGDNIFVNRYLVENGYAKYANSKNNTYSKEIIKSESNAQARNAGIWKDCIATSTRSTARRQEPNVPPTNPKCDIKGNISAIGLGKIYILPHCANYDNTHIDPAKGEGYFCTEEEAMNAGFKKADGCR
jgi:micrococcal nuclease